MMNKRMDERRKEEVWGEGEKEIKKKRQMQEDYLVICLFTVNLMMSVSTFEVNPPFEVFFEQQI